MERRGSARARMDPHRRRARQLVLHLPRASSRRRSLSQRPRLPARRRRPHPLARRRTRHEHRHRRRGQPRVETRRRRARAEPSAALLDSYEPERIAFARRLVATTDQAFTEVTSPSAMARLVRLHIVPLVLPLAFAFQAMRRFMFRTISQTGVNYRDSSLSEGRAGAVTTGGDRLPLGKDRRRRPRQLRVANLARLAGSHLRRSRTRAPVNVRHTKSAAARLSLAAGDEVSAMASAATRSTSSAPTATSPWPTPQAAPRPGHVLPQRAQSSPRCDIPRKRHGGLYGNDRRDRGAGGCACAAHRL